MKLYELDKEEAKRKAKQKRPDLDTFRWVTVCQNNTNYFEQSSEIQQFCDSINGHVSVYYIEYNGELTDYTDMFKKLIPKAEEPNKSLFQKLKEFFV